MTVYFIFFVRPVYVYTLPYGYLSVNVLNWIVINTVFPSTGMSAVLYQAGNVSTVVKILEIRRLYLLFACSRYSTECKDYKLM